MTQQALADAAHLHVSMVRKYEGGTGQPSVDALRRLAVALSVPGDVLLFEAAQRLDPDEKRLVRELIEGLVLKREVRRWAAKG